MRTFTVNYKDLDYGMQADIEQSLAQDVKEDLIEEAKEEFYKHNDKEVKFSTGDLIEFMCDESFYALDRNDFKLDFLNLIDELVAQRIRQNFTSLKMSL